MAVSVNAVYQKVLALANKEQRGYITPQEFNLYADHAQMEIFDQYFYDLHQFERRPGSETQHADMVDSIEEKLSLFKSQSLSIVNGTLLESLGSNDAPFYKLIQVFLSVPGIISAPNDKIVERLRGGQDFHKTQNSPLTKATANRPIYIEQSGQIFISPSPPPPGKEYQARIIRAPKKPNWTYVVVDGKALHNFSANDFQDFELHLSEEPKLVVKILQLAGVGIKDYNLAQLAGQKEASVKQQEKQ